MHSGRTAAKMSVFPSPLNEGCASQPSGVFTPSPKLNHSLHTYPIVPLSFVMSSNRVENKSMLFAFFAFGLDFAIMSSLLSMERVAPPYEPPLLNGVGSGSPLSNCALMSTRLLHVNSSTSLLVKSPFACLISKRVKNKISPSGEIMGRYSSLGVETPVTFFGLKT